MKTKGPDSNYSGFNRRGDNRNLRFPLCDASSLAPPRNFAYEKVDICTYVHLSSHRKLYKCPMAMDVHEISYDDLLKSPAGGECSDPLKALFDCLEAKGRVDMAAIAESLGLSLPKTAAALKVAVYPDPAAYREEDPYGCYVLSSEYLSGNIAEKLKEAKAAAMKNPALFGDNVKALEGLLPRTLRYEEIYVTLGSPWVPSAAIEEFLDETFGQRSAFIYDFALHRAVRKIAPYARVIHDELTGIWSVPSKSLANYVPNHVTYGTEQVTGLSIVEKTLNGRPLHGYKVDKDGKRKVDPELTAALREKQRLLQMAFQEFLAHHPGWREKLRGIYAERFGSLLPRHYDGSFLTLPGCEATLYPYQKDAVARLLFSKNSLLAHDVGSGKTYVFIAAGHEMVRLGQSRKNLYVVPNNILGQWEKIYRLCYPRAKILVIYPRDFVPSKRAATLRAIKNGDEEAILMAYSSFDLLDLSAKRKAEALYQKIALLKGQGGQAALRKKMVKALEKEIEDLKPDEPGLLTFDELMIDRLFLDEAHNYKNAAKGLIGKPSGKSLSMMAKVHYLQKTHEGKGVYFATGTPVSNSIADLYAMQLYLQAPELRVLGLEGSEAWMKMFAAYSDQFEIDVTGATYRDVRRILSFNNLPELSSLLSEVSSFHRLEQEDDQIPEKGDYIDVKIPKSEALDTYVKYLAYRAERCRKHYVKPSEDNMLKITSDGRKAALSLKLVKPSSPYRSEKAAYCADIAAKIYRDTLFEKGTQLIFSDLSIHHKGVYNVYDELKNDLIERGVKAEEIAFAEEASKDRDLFEKVQEGKIRILIGSTFKLGIGVNVQRRLIALHHLDVPWRPSDLTQREGRILRRGNLNKRVYIYRYIAEGSFDAYSWQLLENKQKLIASLLSGTLEVRKAMDAEDTVLDYAEVKALASGNPYAKKRAEAEALLLKAGNNKDRYEKERAALSSSLPSLLSSIRETEEAIGRAERDFLSIPEAPKDKRNELFEILRSNYEKDLLHLLDYRGFGLHLKMDDETHFYLSKEGEYELERGKTLKGLLLIADHFLEKSGEYLETLKNRHQTLLKQKEESLQRIASPNPYVEIVEGAKKELMAIDGRLRGK